MGLRPFRGRKPMNIVMCVCILDDFPVGWKRTENMCFCILCVFPYVPQFQGLYQAVEPISRGRGGLKPMTIVTYKLMEAYFRQDSVELVPDETGLVSN